MELDLIFFTKEKFFLPPPQIIILTFFLSYSFFFKKEFILDDMIFAANSVNVAAPSSKLRPLAKEISKSLVSSEKLFFFGNYFHEFLGLFKYNLINRSFF